MKRAILTVLALGACALQLQAQSFTDNFNSSTALSSYNVYTNATTPLNSPYSLVTAGGIGNSGAVLVSSGSTITSDSTLIYKNTVFDFSQAGKGMTISAMLNVSSQTGGGNRLLQLGFVNENTSGMNGNAGLAFTSLRLSSVGTNGNVYTPMWQTKVAAGTTTVNANLTPNVTLTVGDWYQLSGTFINTGGGNILASGSLQDFGVNGQTAGAVVFNFPNTTLSSLDIASDSTVYAALRGFKADGLNMVDNFSAISVVPEPSAAVLLLLGIGVAVARRSRRA